jgi:hypothetical protein
MSNQHSLTIYFTDGSDLMVNFPKQDVNPRLLAKRVQTALDARQLAIEVDNQLLVIPIDNIKYFKMSPSPEKLPETVILGGSILIDN